jgi:glutathione synthase
MNTTLTAEELEELKNAAIDYALTHGLVVKDKVTNVVSHAPVTLFPSPFPRAAFQEAYDLQPYFNLLVEKIANDDEFLLESLADVPDSFTRQLLAIFRRVKELNHRQTIRLGLLRSDYMIDESSTRGQISIKQVEINTISSSFSSLSALTSNLHTFLESRIGSSPAEEKCYIPENASLESLAKGIAKAWKLYNSKNAVVLMIVQPAEGNIFDQRWIEYGLFERYGIRLIRVTMKEVFEHSKHIGENRALFFKNLEVALVYFRAGYTPDDYFSQSVN